MVVSVKHKFTSLIPDSADTGLIRPSNWNDEHDIVMATARLLGRGTAGTGSAEEISLGSGLSFTGTTLNYTLTSGGITGALGYTPVNKAGDTMSGNLTISKATPEVIIQRASDGQTGAVTFDGADGLADWVIQHVGGTTAFALSRRDAAGAFIDRPIEVDYATGKVTLAKGIVVNTSMESVVDFVMNKNFPQIRLNKLASNQSASIAGQLNGLNQWNAVLGTATAGDLQLNAYDDAGVFIATRMNIDRTTGQVDFSGDVVISSNSPEVQLKRTSDTSRAIIQTYSADGFADWQFGQLASSDAPANGWGVLRRNSTGGAGAMPLSIDYATDEVTLGTSTALTTALGSFKYIKSILLPASTDLDTITDAAPCYTGVGLVNGPITMSGTQWAYVEVKRFANDANYVLQTWTMMNLGGGDQFPAKWERRRYAGVWGSWYPVSGFVTPAHFGCAGSSTAAGATTGETSALTLFLNSPRPKMLDRFYRLAGVANVDMDLQSQHGWQLFGIGGQSGLVLAGGGINLTNADQNNPTGQDSDLVTLKDFMLVKVGYDAVVPLTVAFKDGDTGSSMPGIHMSNVHVPAATTTAGSSGASIALHNVRNGQINDCSVFGRYGTYNGNGFQLSGGASSASVEVYFNNCRANHTQKGFVVLPSGGSVANDDMQGIHWDKCTAIAVDRGWDLNSADGFSEWFMLDTCHAYFREVGVIGTNVGNIRSNHGYYLAHGSLATAQGIAITGTSIEPWNALTYNRIRLDAATGATRIGINAAVQTGIAQGNEVSNATAAYSFGAGWTNSLNT